MLAFLPEKRQYISSQLVQAFGGPIRIKMPRSTSTPPPPPPRRKRKLTSATSDLDRTNLSVCPLQVTRPTVERIRGWN